MTVKYQLTKTLFSPAFYDAMWPNWAVFHKGFFRELILEPLLQNSNIVLTAEQKEELEREYTEHSQRVTARTAPDSIKNIVFILVESYLAAPTDLVIDGKEITPNMNRLKRDSATYYNGHMHPNVSIGRSSDGQFIYMAGLLPLHSEITVSTAKNDTIIGLPEQMRELYPNMKSLTIIPSNPTLWEQKAMSASYGFDKLYSAQDYQKENNIDASNLLNDEMILSYASQKDSQNEEPFFSLILTMSMHIPYDTFIEHGFMITDNNIPQRYRNYLINCHYTDQQIGKYLDTLKERGLYDHSLIIVAADHEPDLRYLDMEGNVSDDLPLFIINGGIKQTQAWDGECNQLDVYTTILDVMGIETQWRGLGHTLLTRNYQTSVTEDTKKYSDWIIRSNYLEHLESSPSRQSN
ncbi:MAG: LTA synthase family protein [Prevotella sp.]|nr:LTA synthase family protein [Prevotella sp.]